MANEITVRKATSEDTETLVRLMEEFYAEADYRLDRRSAGLRTEGFFWKTTTAARGFFDGGREPIGHAVLTVRYTMEHGGLSGYVDDLFVRKEFRRHGAAYSLLLETEVECRKRNCKALIVEVGKDNTAGLKTYEKLGMQWINDGRILYKKALP